MKTRIAALALLALAAPAAQAQLFKCVQGGKTFYQDAPCDDKAKQSTVRPPPPRTVPPAPAAASKAGAAASKAGAPPAATPAAAGGEVMDVMAGFTVCSERVPNFARKYTEAFQGWKMRNAAAVNRLASEPDASQLDARLRQERALPSEGFPEKCAGVATTIQPPEDRGAPKIAK